MRARSLLASFLALALFFEVQPATAAQRTFHVFSASSLNEPLTKILASYSRAHPDSVALPNFASSSSLSTQIQEGAPADIFIAASLTEMKKAIAGTKIIPRKYLKSHIVLGVPVSSKITRISELNGNVTWIQCAHEVPCGVVTDRGLSQQPVTSNPVSLEPSDSSTLAKLLAHAVDAAFIYNTDVALHKKEIRAIDFDDVPNVSTTYYIVLLNQTASTRALYKALTSSATISNFIKAGFGRA